MRGLALKTACADSKNQRPTSWVWETYSNVRITIVAATVMPVWAA